MEEIGNLFLQSRETAGISLKEVSEDLNIDEAILKNIEDGKSGAFSDIFVLKSYISDYAKYLGIDSEKILDQFNEYIFESTSKIPIKEIEKQMLENKKNENSDEIASPYTKPKNSTKNGLYIFIYIFIILAIILAVVWSVKQIALGEQSAVVLGYNK